MAMEGAFEDTLEVNPYFYDITLSTLLRENDRQLQNEVLTRSKEANLKFKFVKPSSRNLS